MQRQTEKQLKRHGKRAAVARAKVRAQFANVQTFELIAALALLSLLILAGLS